MLFPTGGRVATRRSRSVFFNTDVQRTSSNSNGAA
jgi:hypothetical protein